MLKAKKTFEKELKQFKKQLSPVAIMALFTNVFDHNYLATETELESLVKSVAYEIRFSLEFDHRIVAGLDKVDLKKFKPNGLQVVNLPQTKDHQGKVVWMVKVPELGLIIGGHDLYGEVIFTDICKLEEAIEWVKQNVPCDSFQIGSSDYCKPQYWRF